MVRETELKQLIDQIKHDKSKWRISRRGKNLMAMATLGIDADEILNEIYAGIAWQDYVSGPEKDNHHPPIPGDIWIFGMVLDATECYLKFQLKAHHIVFWISAHPAAYPLHYPFR
ncbi:hypothetical protein [Levilactobacillus zymae]|uniref:hypothetical protein n=1 Tax=Levilactobacillus zymae TaxID=267363 RepID=UPI0028B2C286|nr:hypothetical protein [Levilactobacillus zymae]MDT6980574.1 hypothetical protein [Levilactobacillus zymae]